MGFSKDADMSPFEAGRKLLSLESQSMSLNDRIDLVFQDSDLVPLLVQVSKSNRWTFHIMHYRTLKLTGFHQDPSLSLLPALHLAEQVCDFTCILT